MLDRRFTPLRSANHDDEETSNRPISAVFLGRDDREYVLLSGGFGRSSRDGKAMQPLSGVGGTIRTSWWLMSKLRRDLVIRAIRILRFLRP